MTDEPTLNSLIEAGLDAGMSEEAIATDIQTKRTYKKLTWRLLVEEIRRVERDQQRHAEVVYIDAVKRSDDEPRLLPADEEPPPDPHAQLKTMLKESRWVPDEGYVAIGEMTVEQHRKRAEHFRKLAAGNMRTASLHDQWAADIIAAGATCLNEIEEAA